MAGKTLTGIGEDESGRHELAADKSDSGVLEAKVPSTRPTDRMPMSTIIGAMPMVMPVQPFAPVDDDKVAEGLKKLRSLDEPLGPIPSSMPTLKEGIPAVGIGLPTPVNPAAVAAVAAAELLRSRGTAHGHALSAAAAGQRVMAVTVDDRLKGTLLGHDLHLPDLPEIADEGRPAEVRSVAHFVPSRTITPSAIVDFSHGDARFFESEPLNTEYEPEKNAGGHKLMVRGLIFGAVVAVCVVAAIAWTRVRKADAPALEARTAPEQTPPPPAADNNNAVAPTPAAAPPAAAPTAAAPAEPTPGSAPAAAAEPPPPAPAEAPPSDPLPAADIATPPPAPTPAPPRTHPRHEAVATTPRPPTHSPSHVARPAEPAHDLPKPAGPGKRAKVEDDPDGTLPLDE